MAVKNSITEGLLPDVRNSVGSQNKKRGKSAIGEKQLHVGKEITLNGTIAECDSLIVEGFVEATLENASTLEITETGTFRGKVTVDHVIVAGLFEGELMVGKRLTIKSTGTLRGNVSYFQMEVESGGTIEGSMQKISEP
jgi:cytoskeletal protein CcmA (bactofilin family)